MLPAAHRLQRSPDFAHVVRGPGAVRSGGRHLVIHLNRRPADQTVGVSADSGASPRVGFVVSKSVGNAVVRNRVKRVLRHQVADRVGRLPAGAEVVDVVIRANPAAARAATADLGADLDRQLEVALRKLARNDTRAAAGVPTGTAAGTTRGTT